jgi:hypothetical protein
LRVELPRSCGRSSAANCLQDQHECGRHLRAVLPGSALEVVDPRSSGGRSRVGN